MSASQIHSAYFREIRTSYTLEDFKQKLELNDIEKAKKVVAALKRIGVAKAVKKNFNPDTLNEQENEYIITDDISANPDIAYTLNYVGCIYTEDCLIKCYPKYVDCDEKNPKLTEHFKQVLKVLRKFNAKEEQVHLYNGQDDSKTFNRLAVALHLLDDYYANGVYSNLQTIIETNGEGEIDWDKTINETFAILKNNTPYYVELQTINTQSNEFDYFKMLHECVLTECSKELENSGILDLLDMTPVELTPMTLSEFGDTDYIKYRLEQEIRTQFVTKKQNLLKTLYTLIAESKSDDAGQSVSLFGTNNFYHVWEEVCATVFENELQTPLHVFKDAGLFEEYPIDPNSSSDSIKLMHGSNKLIDLIEKSKWQIKEDILRPDGTLIPDIVSIYKDSNDSKVFAILDAKYYCIEQKSGKIYNQPGIQDVVKQFAYHNAFHDFISRCRFEKVGNVFLIPQKTCELEENNPIVRIGDVTLDVMQGRRTNIVAPIQLVELNPSFLFSKYLQNSGMKIDQAKNLKFTKGIYQNHTLFGYLRQDYFDYLIAEPREEMLFYFYAEKNNLEYEIHPEILNCDTFVGYTEDNHETLIIGSVEKSISKLSADELRLLLKTRLGINSYEPTANYYYCVTVKNITPVSYEEYEEELSELDYSLSNSRLHKHSPKVI